MSEPFELSLKPDAGTAERDAITRVTIPLAEYRLLAETYRRVVAQEVGPCASCVASEARIQKLVAAMRTAVEFETVAPIRKALREYDRIVGSAAPTASPHDEAPVSGGARTRAGERHTDTEADRLIRDYGDQAYYKAVEFTVIGQRLGDHEGAKLFATAARDLLQRGYHKRGTRG